MTLASAAGMPVSYQQVEEAISAAILPTFVLRTPFCSLATSPKQIPVSALNEVNAMYTTQAPTHLWLNMLSVGCCRSIPITAPDLIDPRTPSIPCWMAAPIPGKTYAGLTAKASVLLEFSNETLNAAGEGFA
jgi:hypothetical protein